MQIAHGPANDVAATIVLRLSHCKDPQAVLHTVGATLKWEKGYASSLVEGMASNSQGNAALAAMVELVEAVEEETSADTTPVAAAA
jgi:hypothetical protein